MAINVSSKQFDSFTVVLVLKRSPTAGEGQTHHTYRAYLGNFIWEGRE